MIHMSKKNMKEGITTITYSQVVEERWHERQENMLESRKYKSYCLPTTYRKKKVFQARIKFLTSTQHYLSKQVEIIILDHICKLMNFSICVD